MYSARVGPLPALESNLYQSRADLTLTNWLALAPSSYLGRSLIETKLASTRFRFKRGTSEL